MSEIIKLAEKQVIVDPEIIELLEYALANAKEGKTMGVLLLEQGTDGLIGYGTAGLRDRFTVSGALFHALHRVQSDE